VASSKKIIVLDYQHNRVLCDKNYLFVKTILRIVRENIDSLSAYRNMRFSYVHKREIVVKVSCDYTKFDNKQQHKKISSPPKYVR